MHGPINIKNRKELLGLVDVVLLFCSVFCSLFFYIEKNSSLRRNGVWNGMNE